MRLNKRQINKLYKEYNNYFQGDETQIAYELAKDFIYNASREYERFINQCFASHKGIRFWLDIVNKKYWLWKQAVEETAEYLKPTQNFRDTFEERIKKEKFK